MPGWQFSEKVLMDGSPWTAEKMGPMTVDVAGVYALDTLAKLRLDDYFVKWSEGKVKDVQKQIAGEIPYIGESPEAFEKRRPKPQESRNVMNGFNIGMEPPKEPVVSKKPPKIFRWLVAASYVVYIPIMTGVAQSAGYGEKESINAGVFWPFWVLYEMGRFVGDYL
jgi:hypothetical protein